MEALLHLTINSISISGAAEGKRLLIDRAIGEAL
jgi:hypothetical protein